MMRFLRLFASGLRNGLVAIGALAFVGTAVAIADYALTQGSGTTFASLVISTKHYVAHVLCDATAGEAQCAAVDSSGGLSVKGEGTAGSPAGGVVSIQGVTSGTTVPVSGTVTAAQATAGNLNATVVGTGTFAVQAAQATAASLNATVVGTGTFATQLTGATNNINNIAGTVSLPTGAATAANQSTEITSLSTIATNTGAAIPAGTNTIGAVNGTGTAGSASSGVVTIQGIASMTPVQTAVGANTPTGNIAANNTTAVVIKASGGTLYGVQLYGIGSIPAYLKLYNATTATCGSGTPVKRLMIPAASTAANGAGSNVTFADGGISFSTGITYCVTTGIADNDTTAPAASTYLINLDWQ